MGGHPATAAPGHVPVPYSLDDGETFEVRVYRDHPDWDGCGRWYWMRPALLAELFVCAYVCADGFQLARVYREHPGCVLVY